MAAAAAAAAALLLIHPIELNIPRTHSEKPVAGPASSCEPRPTRPHKVLVQREQDKVYRRTVGIAPMWQFRQPENIVNY